MKDAESDWLIKNISNQIFSKLFVIVAAFLMFWFLLKWSAPCSQVAVSTLCRCPTPAARAPVKPASRSHWSCPLKTLSPMGPTRPPPWRKARPRLGKLGFGFFLYFFTVFLFIQANAVYPLLHISHFFFLFFLLDNCHVPFFVPLLITPRWSSAVADITQGHFMCAVSATRRNTPGCDVAVKVVADLQVSGRDLQTASAENHCNALG